MVILQQEKINSFFWDGKSYTEYISLYQTTKYSEVVQYNILLEKQ
jgi:hypothetical protein